MTDRPREVTVWAEQSIYRARIEEATKGLLRKRDGFRFVIERRWSAVSDSMARAEDWRVVQRGPWMVTYNEAVEAGHRWLDAAEARNPRTGDYL